MKKAIVISVMLVLCFQLFAQNTIDDVLTEVEKNNTTLSAYRKSIDAELIGNKTGLTPQNPEVEFNYLWGNPSVIGERTDFSMTQSFDFPTTYGFKSQISDLKNEQAELEYKSQRIDVLYHARVVCLKLTFFNALKIEVNKRFQNARKVADAYEVMLNIGDAGILDYNKAHVNLLNITKELENIEIERNGLLSELAALNGGKSINFTDSLFSIEAMPDNFEEWFAEAEANNPLLQWVNQEMAISEKQIKLNTAMTLPKFHAGYMSEKVVGEQFQGVTLGITIPLWENKNSIKYAKAQSAAVQSMKADAKLQFQSTIHSAYNRALSLQKNVADYRSKLDLYSNNDLLEKAFNKGEISLSEYMYELALYYESLYNLLEMEKEFNLAYAELNRVCP